MNVCAGDSSTDRDVHCELGGSEGSDLDTLQDEIEVSYISACTHACMHLLI